MGFANLAAPFNLGMSISYSAVISFDLSKANAGAKVTINVEHPAAAHAVLDCRAETTKRK
jgi:hypothetical protein